MQTLKDKLVELNIFQEAFDEVMEEELYCTFEGDWAEDDATFEARMFNSLSQGEKKVYSLYHAKKYAEKLMAMVYEEFTKNYGVEYISVLAQALEKKELKHSVYVGSLVRDNITEEDIDITILELSQAVLAEEVQARISDANYHGASRLLNELRGLELLNKKELYEALDSLDITWRVEEYREEAE